MTNYVNYFVTSKFSRLISGHLKSDDLYKKMLGHDGKEAYCCYFDLDEKLLKNEYDTLKVDEKKKKIYKYFLQGQSPTNLDWKFTGKSFAAYEGICRPALNCVSFDFDSEDIQNSLDDVRRFVDWLQIDDAVIFFSGSKGFHVMIPFGYFGLEPSEHLPQQLKDLAKYLKKHFYPTLDDSIYNYQRKFRVPFTTHDKSGLKKVIVDNTSDLEDMLLKAGTFEGVEDFLASIRPYDKKEISNVLVEALEESKRASYEIQKERAGTIEKPSPFEAFGDKLCIKKLLESRCDDVGRNNACLRIVNDYFRTGKIKSKCEEDVTKWAMSNGLPLSEVNTIITNIYERGQNLNFGCQDDIKSTYCSAKCDIWKKLDPEKRPITVDMPMTAEGGKKEFDLVRKMLSDVFGCGFNEATGEFDKGYICKQGKDDLFLYKNNYWQEIDKDSPTSIKSDAIKRKLNNLAGGKLAQKKIESTYKMLITYIPSAKKNMYAPKTDAAAFSNGTLYLREREGGKFQLEFIKEHNPNDYLTSKFDFPYLIDDKRENKMFTELCDRVFLNDPDKAEKINALSEMYGAALMPYFPHLFFMCGKASSGKSTFMLILNEMLNEDDHICSVQPKDWKNFNMEVMVNKLVNMVTDVNTNRPIEDDVVKQIEDRVPVTINRKGKKMLRAPLPALHIFAGNDFMPSKDGASDAMARRWTIIKFLNEHKGLKMRNFAHVCFQSDPQGVINFAIRGLNRLVDNQGYFTKFDASAREIEAWKLESDIVSQFLQDLEGGELGDIILQDGLWISRQELCHVFMEWQDACGYKNNGLVAPALYKSLRQKNYRESMRRGTRGFYGFGKLGDAENGATHLDDSI